MTVHNGACQCGNIEYCFEGDPLNAIFCYCRDCQINTGSDKWFGLWIPKNKLKFTKGTPVTFTRTSDTHHDVHLNFCSDCGTTLCGEVTVGNFYSVSVSSLTSAHAFTPKMSIYAASAPDWAVFPDGVPKFDRLPPGMGG